jgi:plasmid stability protein
VAQARWQTGDEETLVLATLVIRDVEASLRARLKAVAVAHGRSMEEEARHVLRRALLATAKPDTVGFGDAMRALFEPLRGLELQEIERDPPRDPPDLSGQDWDTERA